MKKELLACPFCRELFSEGESNLCPECDIPLRRLVDLPPSHEAQERQALEWEQTAPEDRTLPWHYLGRGRGLLLGLSLLGLGLFFAPWIVITKPELLTLSGFELATSRGFWFGGGAVAWFVSVPLIFTRRTVMQMRGVRIVSSLFAATTFCQALMLYINAPTQRFVPLAYTWGWGFYAGGLVSLAAIPVAVRFGGPLANLPAVVQNSGDAAATTGETSGGEVLH